jgi:hypothetical protein
MSTLTKLLLARRILNNRLPLVLSRSYHDDGVYGYRVRKEYQLPDCKYINVVMRAICLYYRDLTRLVYIR